MIRALRCLAALLVVSTLTSCAGGWRNGVPPQGLSEGTAAVAAPAKAASAPQATADGMTFKYSGAGNTVALAGEFNAWSTSADPLVKGSDGVWAITKKLAPGRYAYKFVIDGGTWKDDPSAKESVDDGFGGKNSIAVVGAGGGAAMAAAAPVAAATPTAAGDGATFRYSGAGNTVNLAGEFNAWSTSADPMKKGADGVWTLTKKLAPGRYAYKFVVDGSNWKEDPAAKETVDDGFGGKNAIMVVGAGAASAAPAAAAAAPAAATGTGTTFRYSGAGNTVNLAGEFNAWSTSADAMTKGADGVWTITKPLAAGRYAYKFVVDGSNWKEDPAAKETVDDGFGGKNAIVVVGAGAASTAPAAMAAAPTAAKAVTGKPKAPVVSAAGVLFTYAGGGRSVSLCGSFNDWAANADPMTQQADGTWTITKKLKAGSHSYKFLVDGAQWKTDEANSNSEDDGFGGKNSVVLVK